MSEIKGRCIWIIGANKGLGHTLALQLAEAGNFIIASARSQSALAKLATQYPGHIKILPVDVSHAMDSSAVAKQLREITDYLDMVICAEDICEYEDNFSVDPAGYQRLLDVNFLGVVRLFNLALPLLKSTQQRAHFVAISNLSNCVGAPRAEANGAAKAALNYFMQSLRADFAKRPIDFSLVRSGFIASPLTAHADSAMPFIQTPEAVSKDIIKQLSRRKFAIDLPCRLSRPLRLGGVFFNLWCRWIAPRITRPQQW